MTDDEDPVIKRLDVLIGLLTMNISKSVDDQIKLLHSLGLGGSQIAQILGKTKGHVDKTLYKKSTRDNKK